MARGLNGQTLFSNDHDYHDFLRRFEPALRHSKQEILGWALMPNHVHLLIRSGSQGLSSFMRRVLTGYASFFNRQRKRTGYVFQGRYKSIVCEQEEYLMTLVRYIHLNPVSAGLIKGMSELRRYPQTGHAALMGGVAWPWQSIDEVLGRFGKQAGPARVRYEKFLEAGIPQLRDLQTDLLGAGLLEELQAEGQSMRRATDRALSDPRVLGDSEFVANVWKEADKKEKTRVKLRRKGIGIRGMAKKIARQFGVAPGSLFAKTRERSVSAAKAALVFVAVEYLGESLATIGRLTRMTNAGASKARSRGAAAGVRWRKLIS
jgi:putative transposase